MPRGPAMALLRVSLYGLVAGLLVYSLVGQLQVRYSTLAGEANSQQHQIADLQATVAEMQTTIDDLRSRWIGDPALWQPSGVPGNTVVQYFDVSGTTQADLIQALADADLCGKYKCLVDPAVPANSVAWALEDDGQAVPNSAYCYSPSSLSYRWAQHTITMPRWNPKPGSVKIDLVQKWNALEAAMLVHEIGHVNVADTWLSAENAQAQHLSTCAAAVAFWQDPHLFDGLDAAQNAYHAKLRADCRPEIGCVPSGWMGW